MNFISVIAELNRIGEDWKQASETEIKVVCPFHDDSSPSLYINTEKKVCDCKSCSWDGPFLGYLAKKEGKLLAEINYEMHERYGITAGKSIPPQRVINAHKNIWNEHALMQELFARGVTTAEIKTHKLGVERKRIVIPVFDERGYCVNLRKYLPGAPGDKKFRDERGCGKTVRLYPIEQKSYPNIVLCGGEIKALSAIKYLSSQNIGALSATGGEGRWSVELTEELNGKKKVWIIFDIDAAGRSAAQNIARQLAAYVEWLGIVQLPLDKNKFPHGGVDDYIVQGGDILELLHNCEEYVPMKELERDYGADPITECNSLTEVVNSNFVERRISVDCVISTIDTMPYPIPKEVKVKCNKSVDWCQICPLHPVRPEDMVVNIHPENSAILGMIDVGDEGLNERIKKACKIPSLCKVCTFEVLSFQHAEDVRISEHLEVTKRSEDKAMLPAIIVSDDVQMNVPYRLTARLYPHPKTNQTVLLGSELTKQKDSIDTFDVTQTSHLELFRPEEWTLAALKDKLDHIYTDIEANVTRIYQRRNMHLMMDLAYHSPLFLTNIFGKPKEKGWVEVLIVGDSSQGKTEAALGLQQHYLEGGWLSCKGASFAGVVGGVQQINKKWFITWGAMPLQDRKLLIFEELKGLPQEIFQKLTDVRSSGKAEIAKIERQQTYARVRIIALTNPRKDRTIGSHNDGVQVIQELIGSLEDIRRFDGFYVARKEDVDEDVIGRKVVAEHVYTSQYCRDLLLWSWCVPETIFEDEDYLLAKSKEFGRNYTDDVPIYDRGGGRFKIARMAAALACRTFSCEDPHKVIIRKCHVDYVCNFLHTIYQSDAMGYRSYSERRKEISKIPDEEVLLKEINSFPSPRHFASTLLRSDKVDANYLASINGWDNEEGRSLISMLLKYHCIQNGDKGQYNKTAAFVAFLKTALDHHEIVDRPQYLDQPDPESQM